MWFLSNWDFVCLHLAVFNVMEFNKFMKLHSWWSTKECMQIHTGERKSERPSFKPNGKNGCDTEFRTPSLMTILPTRLCAASFSNSRKILFQLSDISSEVGHVVLAIIL